MAKPISKTTSERKEIQTEEDENQPSIAKSGEPGIISQPILRIDFPDYLGGYSLEEIDEDEWFEIFEEKKLAFLYQEKTSEGKEIRFFKLLKREIVAYET